MTTSITQPEKESFYLVSFTNLVTNTYFAKFTTLDSDYTFEGQDYTSETRMTVKLPRNDGALGDDPCEIGLPRELQFAQDITVNGRRYPATQVRVIEVVKGDGAISTTVLRPHIGLMVRAKRKVGGRKSMVTVRSVSSKARWQDIKLGLQCMPNCVNRLGDQFCQVSMVASPRRLANVTIVSIDGAKVTVEAADVPSGSEDRFYQRGFLIKDGFEFVIRDWRNEVEGNKAEFFLFRAPPAEWVGENVTVFSGCDKTTRTCEIRYNNLSQFKGAGKAMPAYHPVYEDGGARQ